MNVNQCKYCDSYDVMRLTAGSQHELVRLCRDCGKTSIYNNGGWQKLSDIT